MQEALKRFAGELASHRHARILGPEEEGLLTEACSAFTDVLCPFIADCLARIFPSLGQLLDLKQIAEALNKAEIRAEDCQVVATESRTLTEPQGVA